MERAMLSTGVAAARSVGLWLWRGDALAQALLCVTLLTLLRDVLAVCYRHRRAAPATAFPPVSILKPVHGPEPAAATGFLSYCLLDYPAPFEVIFVLEDTAQPLYALASALAHDFEPHVSCVISGAAADPLVNGKAHNLAAAASAARFDWLLISDSDTVAEPDILRRLVEPLRDPRVGAVSATPRVTLANGPAARLERLLVNQLLAPFEYAAAQLHGPHGLWGTLLLVERNVVARAGGFCELGRYLAEDIALERSLRAQGRRGALIGRPIDVICAEMGTGGLLRHWHRWLVGLRRMRPLTHTCIALILLGWLLPLVVLASLWLEPGAVLERCTALAVFVLTLAVSQQLLRRAGIAVREGWTGFLLLPVAVCALLVAYVWSFVSTTVNWRGRCLRIRRGGRIMPPP